VRGWVVAVTALSVFAVPTLVRAQATVDTGSATIFFISAGSLPAGLSLSASTGAITGTTNVAGSFTFTIAISKGCVVVTRQYTMDIPPPIPANFTANATSATSVGLSWSSSASNATYEILKSVNHVDYTLLTETASTSVADNGLTTNTTYLYKIRAKAGGLLSPFSAIEPATTILFTNDPLLAGTPIASTHFTELRTAVNAMRAAAALNPQSYTDPTLTPGTLIQAIHLTQLRTALDE